MCSSQIENWIPLANITLNVLEENVTKMKVKLHHFTSVVTHGEQTSTQEAYLNLLAPIPIMH